MNLVFSENTGEYLNKTSTNVIPTSQKAQISELSEGSKEAQTINNEQD